MEESVGGGTFLLCFLRIKKKKLSLLFWNNFRLSRLQREFREFLYNPHPVFPNVSILHNNSTFVKTKKLT